MYPQENVTVRVKQSLPVHPMTHVHLLGATHSLLVEHGGLQIAVMRGNKNYNVSTRKSNHTR